MTSIANTLGLLATLGLADSMLRRRLSGEVGRPAALALLRFVIVPATVIALIVCVLAFIFIPDSGTRTTVAAGAIASIPITVLVVGQQFLRAESRPGAFFVNVLLWQAGATSVGVVATLLAGGGLELYLTMWILGLAAAATTSAAQAGAFSRRSSSPLRGRLLMKEVRTGTILGFPLLMHTLIGTATAMIDRIFLSIIDSSAAVAIYQITYLVGLAPVVALGAINNWWGVRLFSTNPPRSWRIQTQEMGIIAGVAAVMVGGVVGVSTYATKILLGTSADHTPAVQAIALLSCVGASQVFYFAATNALYHAGRTAAIALRTVPFAIAQTLAGVSLMPWIGYFGPVLAVLTIQSIQAAVIWIYARKTTELRAAPVTAFVALIATWSAAGLVLILQGAETVIAGISLACVGFVIILYTRSKWKGGIPDAAGDAD